MLGRMRSESGGRAVVMLPTALGSKNLPAGLSKVSLRESARRYIRLWRSVSGMWRRRVRGEVLDMTISWVSRVPRVSGDRRGFEIFSRHVGPGTWYPHIEKSQKNLDTRIRTKDQQITTVTTTVCRSTGLSYVEMKIAPKFWYLKLPKDSQSCCHPEIPGTNRYIQLL